MAEYIEREAVLAKQYNASNFVDPMLAEMVVDVRDIEDIPAADVVEVCRCKDCKHMMRMMNACYCTVWGGFNGYGEDGFCCYGERKAE